MPSFSWSHAHLAPGCCVSFRTKSAALLWFFLWLGGGVGSGHLPLCLSSSAVPGFHLLLCLSWVSGGEGWGGRGGEGESCAMSCHSLAPSSTVSRLWTSAPKLALHCVAEPLMSPRFVLHVPPCSSADDGVPLPVDRGGFGTFDLRDLEGHLWVT